MTGALPESADAIDAVLPVSRETKERLALFVALLVKWQRSQNLISPNTLPHVWTRHVADSAQALAVLPHATRWVDLGSGAGFPGLVTAVCLAGVPGAVVHLVESNTGKAAFLRTVARETGAPAVVHAVRADAVVGDLAGTVQAVSARALAPLGELCRLARPLIAAGATAVFHKGQDFASELAQATQSWDLDLVQQPSRINPGGSIVIVRRCEPL